MLAAVRAGADGYLTKDAAARGPRPARCAALDRGEAPSRARSPRTWSTRCARGDRRRELAGAGPDREHLTPRQLEILQLLAAGSTTGEIARELYLSVETVRWHVKAILRKLGVQTRAEAIACLLELGAT